MFLPHTYPSDKPRSRSSIPTPVISHDPGLSSVPTPMISHDLGLVYIPTPLISHDPGLVGLISEGCISSHVLLLPWVQSAPQHSFQTPVPDLLSYIWIRQCGSVQLHPIDDWNMVLLLPQWATHPHSLLSVFDVKAISRRLPWSQKQSFQ